MLVNFSGSMASCFQAKFGKYTSAVRLLIVNLPLPARRNTRATDSLRRPVPWNQVFEVAGDSVLNCPPDPWWPLERADNTANQRLILSKTQRLADSLGVACADHVEEQLSAETLSPQAL